MKQDKSENKYHSQDDTDEGVTLLFFYKFIEIVRILAVESSSEIIHIEGLGEMSKYSFFF